MSAKKLIPEKIALLFTIVNSGRAEYYKDIISDYNCNLQLDFSGEGSAPIDIANLWGLVHKDKDIVVSIVRQEQVKSIIKELDEKFILKNDKSGIAFSVPIGSVVGVLNYQFLVNDKRRNKNDK